MSVRPKIETMLPKRLRDQLDTKLIDGSFSHYRELAEWLDLQGFAISRSALHRYGSQLERHVQSIALATDQARAIVNASPDREGVMADALGRLVQERLWMLLVETNDLSERDLPRLARAVADLGRATISQKRWQEEMSKRLEAQKAAAVMRVSEEETRGGLSAEAAETIREILLGIDPLKVKEPFDGRAEGSAR